MTSSQGQLPYDITLNVWRDEQPGSMPTLHVSIQLTPFHGQTPWRGVELDRVGLVADGIHWVAENSVVEPLSDGVFQVRADGAATIEAGAEVTVVIQLTTSEGHKMIELTGSVVDAVE